VYAYFVLLSVSFFPFIQTVRPLLNHFAYLYKLAICIFLMQRSGSPPFRKNKHSLAAETRYLLATIIRKKYYHYINLGLPAECLQINCSSTFTRSAVITFFHCLRETGVQTELLVLPSIQQNACQCTNNCNVGNSIQNLLFKDLDKLR